MLGREGGKLSCILLRRVRNCTDVAGGTEVRCKEQTDPTREAVSTIAVAVNMNLVSNRKLLFIENNLSSS